VKDIKNPAQTTMTEYMCMRQDQATEIHC